MLLKGGADPNVAEPEDGNTLLHTTESPEVMAALFEAKADPNLKNKVLVVCVWGGRGAF